MSTITEDAVIPNVSPEYRKRLSGQTKTSWSASDLMRMSKENPPVPIIQGLLFEGDMMVLHGAEESFKSHLIVQIADSIASGCPFLRKWDVVRALSVGIIETEMHPAMLGERLHLMFKETEPPRNMHFMDDNTLQAWRRADLPRKTELIKEWVKENEIDVLMVDTANDFFRGAANPSDERHVGELFDRLRNLKLRGIILVRHDHKKRESDGEVHSNELIRGSAEWKEDPEVILHITRVDKRTNQAKLEVGKLRYGAKPEPFEVWFDAGSFRLTPLPPVIALLTDGPKTREELAEGCESRFGVAERTMAVMINANEAILQAGTRGHRRTFEINQDRLADTEWASYLTHPGA
jgi:hypothetical protein